MGKKRGYDGLYRRGENEAGPARGERGRGGVGLGQEGRGPNRWGRGRLAQGGKGGEGIGVGIGLEGISKIEKEKRCRFRKRT